MAEIVSVIALAHAPGATGWLDQAPKHEQDALIAYLQRLGHTAVPAPAIAPSAGAN